MPNITDSYDQKRLDQVGKIIQAPGPDGRVQKEEDPHTSVISMKDAIAIADDKQHDYTKRTDLSDKQKFLIATVADERKSDTGKVMTDRLAARGEWLSVDNSVDHDGANNDTQKLITINQATGAPSFHAAIHHEMTHALQPAMPGGLSSYDQKMWNLGREGQAFVAEEDEAARRKNPDHKGLTDEQKRQVFSKYISEEAYAQNYDLENSTRTDGRKLTVAEYEKAFGTLPGHENEPNFLAGGKYKDVSDVVEGSSEKLNSPFAEAKKEADRKPVKYGDLPVASPGSDNARFESKDKSYVILVAHKKGSDDAHVEIYRRKHLDSGDAYVLADSHDVKTTEALAERNKAKGVKGTESSYVRTFSDVDNNGGKLFDVNVHRNGQVTATEANQFHGTDIYDKDMPLEQHKNTLYERFRNPTIQDLPAPSPGKQNQERKLLSDNALPEGGAGTPDLPDNVKSAVAAMGEKVRNSLGAVFTSDALSVPAEKLQDVATLRDVMSDARGMVSGGHEAATAQNNAYVNNAAAKDAGLGGRT